jgi:hypothetical protein
VQHLEVERHRPFAVIQKGRVKEGMADFKAGAGDDAVVFGAAAVFEIHGLSLHALDVHPGVHLAVPDAVEQFVVDRGVGLGKLVIGFLQTVQFVVPDQQAKDSRR